jgi:hypothetical protein
VQGGGEGSLEPSGQVTTNDQGEATLTYTAGRSSETVRIVARHQPMGYKERVTAERAVTAVEPMAGGGVGEFETVSSTDQQDRFHRRTAAYVARGRLRFEPMANGYWFPCRASVSSEDRSAVTHPRPEHQPDSYHYEWAEDEVACHLEYQWPRRSGCRLVIESLRRGRREATSFDPGRPLRWPLRQAWITSGADVRRGDVRVIIHVIETERLAPAPGTLHLAGRREKDVRWLKEAATWSFRLRETAKAPRCTDLRQALSQISVKRATRI